MHDRAAAVCVQTDDQKLIAVLDAGDGAVGNVSLHQNIAGDLGAGDLALGGCTVEQNVVLAVVLVAAALVPGGGGGGQLGVDMEIAGGIVELHGIFAVAVLQSHGGCAGAAGITGGVGVGLAVVGIQIDQGPVSRFGGDVPAAVILTVEGIQAILQRCQRATAAHLGPGGGGRGLLCQCRHGHHADDHDNGQQKTQKTH